MFEQLLEIEKIPDFSLIGLFYSLLGFMVLVICLGWISKIITASRLTTRKQTRVESDRGALTRQGAPSLKRKSR